ncbi:TolC family protein [Alteromonas sp. a30]|uniref:TolC family protein n=1 Tax=Alteromonas sp. a30 TaxID=2730917 RepID=UPI0022820F33|nr:TolC family protein [Alteromonas sp. a30]MCY7295525.1 TolC family protein [Alteromonas sp. a30]
MPLTLRTKGKPIISRFLSAVIEKRKWATSTLLSGSLLIMAFQVGAAQEQATQQDTLTLTQAVQKTLAQHPEMRAYGFMQDAAQGYVQQAAVGTPLSMDIEVEDALGTGVYSGISRMQTTLSLMWLLEHKLLQSQVGVATQKAELAHLQKQINALDLAAETATIFITLLSQKQELQLAKLAQSQARKMLAEIEKRVRVGKLNAIDELRATAYLSKKSLVVEDLLHEIEASKEQLAAQWHGSSHFVAIGSLDNIPNMTQLESAYDKLKSNPKLRYFATQQRVAEAEISLAKVSAVPSWRVTAGIRRNEANDDVGFVARLSIPFGVENRNQGKIRALQAGKQQQQAESEALYQRLETQVLLLIHRLEHNHHVVDSLSNEVIPALESAERKAQQAYQIGNYRYTDWYAIQQELIDAQDELILAYANMQFINIELERLTGASISQ